MDFQKFTFTEDYKGGKTLCFDFDIRTVTGHIRNTFKYYRTLIHFLTKNPDKEIYITQSQTEDFDEKDNKLVINLQKYQEFCRGIGQNGENRAQAFFARRVQHFSEDEKLEIINTATEEQIIERIKSFSVNQKESFLNNLKSIGDIKFPREDLKDVTDEDFLRSFSDLLDDPNKRAIIVAEYTNVQLRILEEYKIFLEANLDKNELFVQNWIDGKIDNEGNDLELDDDERKRLQKSRCLIFGLEFIDHKREGQASSKRFDVLTRLSEDKNEYVLFELKSPDAGVFKIVEKENQNGGTSTEYHLSEDVARAIPQILRYRDNLESKSEEDEDWQRIGVPKGKIAKCIILIGTRKTGDPLWESHFLSIKRNFCSSLEIMTYSDLIKKLETTISNLKNNL